MSTSTDRKVISRMTVRRERVLPIPGEVLVQAGQRVGPDTIIARTEVLAGDPYVIDLKHHLRKKLTAREVSEAMLKRVGDRVSVGEPIAQIRRGLFGEILEVTAPVEGVIEFISRSYARVLLREDPKSAVPVAIVPVSRQLDVWPATLRMYMRYREGDEVLQGAALADSPGIGGLDYSYAPISGIIEKIDTRTGNVTIVRPARPTMVESYLSGTVARVIPELGALVECDAAYVQGVFGVGFESYGYLRLIPDTGRGRIEASDLGGELRDHVLVTRRLITLQALQHAAAAGARGIIAGGIDHLDLVKYVGAEIGVGITGQEDVPVTVVLTEGFGEMPMAPWTYELLQEHQGKLVSLNGSTQVRAGVIRPEVIIPLGEAQDALAESEAEAASAPPASPRANSKRNGLEAGARVRILRKPYFGQWGEVLVVPEGLLRLETEALARVVTIKLEDGREVTVPQANVEPL